MKTTDEALGETRELLRRMSSSMPVSVDVLAIGVRQKAPYIALRIREGLYWRVEELGRHACDALERKDIAAGALLTRAVIESTALMWRLRDFLIRRKDFERKDLDEKLLAMLMGHRNVPGMPEAVGISNHIDRLEKAIPGVAKVYARLSEVAHPNWTGVNGLYSETDYENHITIFGRDLKASRVIARSAAIELATTLKIFEHAYNGLGTILPSYIAEFDPL